jgi:adenine C2-methylase RlmN of 23S rRNA A2503 and tRNA A37
MIIVMMNFEPVTGPVEFHEKRSKLDESVNYSKPSSDGGMIETRFVRRREDRFIVYISSMTGCNKACRFCHLTQTGQTMAKNLSVHEMVEQAKYVLARSHFSAGETVHFNFMARGEPLSNPNVGKPLFEELGNVARGFGLNPRIKVSTIMPSDMVDGALSDFVPAGIPVDIYYSLYSMDVAWRRRWVPKALPAEEGLRRLAAFQRQTAQRVIIHGALIADENDGDGVG